MTRASSDRFRVLATWRRTVLWGVALSGSVLATGIVTQWRIGERALAACDEAVARGDRSESILQARLAAEAIAPFSPYPQRGRTRLIELGDEATARGDDRNARQAWEAIRRSEAATQVRAREDSKDEPTRPVVQAP